MRILLFGCDGQVGWELQRALAPLGELFAYNKQTADFEDIGGLRKIIRNTEAEVIVNAAAYTAVDQAEQEFETAHNVNTKAVALLAEESMLWQSLLIHYSADYVFDGEKKGVYTEEDTPNPLNVYGKTKFEGEQVIQLSGCNHLIFRTSWVYGTHGHNFIKTIMKRFREKSEITVVSDQFGAPTSASLIGDITALALYNYFDKTHANSRHVGIYNLVASGETSWYEFAHFILEKLQNLGLPELIDSKNVTPVLSKDYKALAHRPKNGRLSTKKLIETFGLFLPHWKTGVERVINELIGGDYQ